MLKVPFFSSRCKDSHFKQNTTSYITLLLFKRILRENSKRGTFYFVSIREFNANTIKDLWLDNSGDYKELHSISDIITTQDFYNILNVMFKIQKKYSGSFRFRLRDHIADCTVTKMIRADLWIYCERVSLR